MSVTVYNGTFFPDQYRQISVFFPFNCIEQGKSHFKMSKLLFSVCFFRSNVNRPISTGSSLQKIVPSNLSGKSKSSQEWLTRQLNDQYSKKARYENYRCRSAFKLLEINERFRILRPGLSVVECGAAPGSWTQVAVRQMLLDKKELYETNGCVIAVDIQYMLPVEGATVLKEMDFTQPETQDHIISLLPSGEADVILSDMAPNATGVRDLDSANISKLVYSVLKFSLKVLKKDGTLLCKMWNSGDVPKLVDSMYKIFGNVKRIKPNASHADSSEIFLLGKGFKGLERHWKIQS